MAGESESLVIFLALCFIYVTPLPVLGYWLLLLGFCWICHLDVGAGKSGGGED